MALTQINNPKYHGEVNHYRGLSNLQSTLERLMKDVQGWVMEVMKELMTVKGQLSLCKKRLEISNAYKELDSHFPLANPVPIHPCHSLIHSPLVEAPRIVWAIAPLPSHTRGVVEMPILHSNDPDHCQAVWFFRCQKVGYIVSQYPRKKKSCKCTTCGGTHKVAKCSINTDTTSLEVVTNGAGKDADGEKMTLLDILPYLTTLSIHLPTAPSVVIKTWSTWRWSAQCMSNASGVSSGD